MEGTDIEQIDTNVRHSHTYYGKGCPWSGGYNKSCDIEEVNTADDEPEEIGTFYNYAASSSDSAPDIIEKDNTLIPDTFCPLGWQLPYSGTGGDYYDQSRSWANLYTIYHIEADSAANSTAIQSYPFSYITSGYYSWVDGKLYSSGISGYYWSIIVNSGVGAYSMGAWSAGIRYAIPNSRYHGFMLRCILEISIPKGLPWHPGNCSYMHISTGNIARRALA